MFTPQRAKGKTYPLTVILESLMADYRGETREQTAALCVALTDYLSHKTIYDNDLDVRANSSASGWV